MSLLLHYDCLAEFESQYFEGLLTQMHIVEHEKYIKEVREKGNENPVELDDYFTILEKDNKKYLLPSKFVGKLPIKVQGVPEKYSLKQEVYHVLRGPNVASAKFRPEKTMSVEEFVDRLTSFEHTHQDYYKLLGVVNITQMLDRANFRVATPAGFGKDSLVDTLGHLFGEAHTIENPTIAKLERMTYAKLLAVNEVVDISGTEWRNIEQFLLSTGAFKNKVTKRSRAYGGVAEILDTSNLSLSLMYNDVTHYPSGVKYFDDVTKEAVKDRFPALRLPGRLIEDFNKISEVSIPEYVREHKDDYIAIIRMFYYLKDNLVNEMHFYDKPSFEGLPPRWQTNIGRVLKLLDAMSSDQTTFDRWSGLLLKAINDYDEMTLYRQNLFVLAERLRVSKEDFKKEPTMGYLKGFLRSRYRVTGDKSYQQQHEYLGRIDDAETFAEKNTLIKFFEPGAVQAGLDQW